MTSNQERVIGVWALVSHRRFRDGQFYRESMGANPRGRIIYDASGKMAAFLMAADWAGGEHPPHWESFFAYSGVWHLRDAETVVHDVDFCTSPQVIGQPLVRSLVWQDDGTLKLVTEGHVTRDGAKSHDELVWKRELAPSS